jgi:hypothetical protein
MSENCKRKSYQILSYLVQLLFFDLLVILHSAARVPCWSKLEVAVGHQVQSIF